ncbi:hydantoin racemase [Xylaria intraflava]|nr:hydantoin racemase [Xylaria intraflava]
MSTTLVRGRGTKILLLNPNSSTSMTDGIKTVVNDIELPDSTEVYTYTAPSTAPASINDADDLRKSMSAVLANFEDFNEYDAIIVACYSHHPLVLSLQELCGPDCVVTGIFEASLLTALSLLRPSRPRGKWGIVTTGEFWERHLADGVREVMGVSDDGANTTFAGVQSTGLNASDFHDGVDPAIVRLKLMDATARLLDVGNVSVIVMGCAGMAGLEGIIREAAKDLYGELFAYSTLHVIDGVRAGVMQVDQIIRNQRLRPGQS